MTQTITAIPSVEFWPPLVAPQNLGLFAVTDWEDSGDVVAERFTIGGVNIRTINYGGENSSGVWDAPWCGTPNPSDQVKGGVRPTFPDPFEPIHVWAWDSCEILHQADLDYIRLNAQRWLAIQEQNDVETAFATRLVTEAGTPMTSTSFLNALGKLEAAIAKTRLPGFIHLSPELA